ncbi:hypothetical protein G3M54_03395 [Bacillus megaterium NBRC 15308 = ATCC 14581]|nr:hypothetical protein [Priestia megaterium NBRC 15308 = ATCC 14581]
MTEKKYRKDNFLSESFNDTFTESIQEANKSAVVVGASLSGLMAGIALARAGLNVTILEELVWNDVVELVFKLTVEKLIELKQRNS